MHSEYKICLKTVMDTSDENIVFDEEGISNHYWDFQHKVLPNWHYYGNRGDKLNLILKKIRNCKKNNEFNCILGLSGGLDSSYLLHKIVTEFNLRPLVFHVDGGWNSDVAVSNINNLVDKLGLDLYTEVINWEEMKKFQVAMFKSGVPHLDIPQDMAFISVLYKFAEKYNIKYILNGGNISTECVLMPLKILYWGTDMTQINDILNRFCSGKLKKFPFSNIYYHKIFLKYFKRIKVIKPLNYIRYFKDEAMKELSELYNWKPYGQKHHESRFTKFLESYWLPTRFNYDMRKNQLSSLILTDQITRDQALEILQEPSYDIEAIENDKEFIANKLDLSIKDINDFHSMPKKYYFDYKNEKQIFDIGEKVLNFFSSSRRGGAY